MRDPGPRVLFAVMAVLGVALAYDLARPRQPVSEARFEWQVARTAKLPWLGDPYPAPRASRTDLPGALAPTMTSRYPHTVDGSPPLGSEPEPPRPLPSRAADPERLATAREILGAPSPLAARLGPYDLLTDVADPVLLERLARLVEDVESAYRGRYALAPIGVARETIVLFADADDYAAFVRGEERLREMLPAGYTARGLVALPAGGRPWEDVAATLVHEVVHLLNRRSLGPALPPWLDEGMASDLGISVVDERGRLLPGSFGGSVIESTSESGSAITYTGGRAALIRAGRHRRTGTILSPEELTSLPWLEFVRRDAEELTYATSLLCLRQLLADDVGAVAFRGFLQDVAAGRSAEGTALRERLGWTWREWNERLGRYVAESARALPDAVVRPAA